MSDAVPLQTQNPFVSPGVPPLENVYSTTEAPRLGSATDYSTLGQWKIYRRAAKTAQSVPHASRRFPLVGFLHIVRPTRRIGGTSAGS